MSWADVGLIIVFVAGIFGLVALFIFPLVELYADKGGTYIFNQDEFISSDEHDENTATLKKTTETINALGARVVETLCESTENKNGAACSDNNKTEASSGDNAAIAAILTDAKARLVAVRDLSQKSTAALSALRDASIPDYNHDATDTLVAAVGRIARKVSSGDQSLNKLQVLSDISERYATARGCAREGQNYSACSIVEQSEDQFRGFQGCSGVPLPADMLLAPVVESGESGSTDSTVQSGLIPDENTVFIGNNNCVITYSNGGYNLSPECYQAGNFFTDPNLGGCATPGTTVPANAQVNLPSEFKIACSTNQCSATGKGVACIKAPDGVSRVPTDIIGCATTMCPE